MGFLGTAYVQCRVLFSLGSFGALCKISDVKISKRLLRPQFSFIFEQTLQKACNRGKYRVSLFLGTFKRNLKVYDTLKISYLSYIAIIHKAMLVASGEKFSRSLKSVGLSMYNLEQKGFFTKFKRCGQTNQIRIIKGPQTFLNVMLFTLNELH